MKLTWLIDEVKKSSRLKLFQERRALKYEASRFVITGLQYKRLNAFFQNNKGKFFSLLFCLIIQALLEISLPIYSQTITSYSILKNQMVWHFAGLSLALVLYLITAFIFLFLEKTLIIKLINELREHWFKILLYKPLHKSGSHDKAKLIAKVTYHFSLLQVSLGACFSGSIRFVLNFIILLVFAILSSKVLVFYVLASSVFSFILLIIGYYIGQHYLSREASLSSAIITHISEDIDQIAVLQNQAREKESLKQLRRLVSLDSELKIRRNLWMTYGNNIIFASLLIGGVFASVYASLFSGLNFSSLISRIDLFSGLIAALLIRQLYLGFKIGLNLVPAKIGLALSLPQPEKAKIREEKLGEFNEIIFKTKKARLTYLGAYLKDIILSFNIGSAYLFYGQSQTGKSRLTKVISGQATEDGKPWTIKLNGQRFLYRTWRTLSRRTYLVSGNINGSASIVEIIAGEDRTKIGEEKLSAITSLISSTPALDFLSKIPKLIAADIDKTPLTEAEKVLLELAYCIINKPNLIVIDNLVFDLADSRIKDLVIKLASRLDKSILVIFASHKLDYLSFNKVYEITKKDLKEIN